MNPDRRDRKNKNAAFQRAVVSVLMFAIVAGGVVTYSMYQQRKATEAVIYERNQNGELTADGQLQTVYLADTGYAAAPFEVSDLSTFDYYLQARNSFVTDTDGTVWYGGKHYRRVSYIKAILAVGVDRSDGIGEGNDPLHSGQNDVDVIIAQDTARGKVKMLMIPRNSVVKMQVSDWEGHFIDTAYDQLCMAFSHGNGGDTSVQNTLDAVTWTLCGLEPDHYAMTDMGILNRVNDLVGGVTVTVPNDELAKANPAWTKGATVRLTGGDAERFIRFRDTSEHNTALYRMQQHRAYILGFYQTLKAQSRVNSSIVTDLYDLMQNDLLSDLKKDEFLKLVLDAMSTDNLTAEDITTLPGISIAGDEDYIWDRVFIDYANAIPVILEMFYREI